MGRRSEWQLERDLERLQDELTGAREARRLAEDRARRLDIVGAVALVEKFAEPSAFCWECGKHDEATEWLHERGLL